MPAAYSTSITESEKDNQKIQTATLTIISEVEAKIESTTYTKLEEAIKAARNLCWN